MFVRVYHTVEGKLVSKHFAGGLVLFQNTFPGNAVSFGRNFPFSTFLFLKQHCTIIILFYLPDSRYMKYIKLGEGVGSAWFFTETRRVFTPVSTLLNKRLCIATCL